MRVVQCATMQRRCHTGSVRCGLVCFGMLWGAAQARLGKLVLGDLAGSERASKTGAQGTLLTEGALINKGLSE